MEKEPDNPLLPPSQKSVVSIPWPELEEVVPGAWQPKTYLPACPSCGEYELALIGKDRLLCYHCSWEQRR